MAAWQGPIIGRDTETGAWVHLDDQHRNGGFYILGNTRSGKSTMMLNLIIDDMVMGSGLMLMEPKGSLVDAVLRYVPKDRVQDVILIDFSDPHYSVGLNLYDCHGGDEDLIASQAVGIFKKTWHDSWGQQLEDVLRNCTYTLIENPGMTMAEIPLLLNDDDFRARLVKNVTNVGAKVFWENEFNEMRGAEQRRYYESTIRRVRSFLSNATLRHIVGQSRSTIDLAQIMAQQKILLVKLPMGRLGDEVISLVGSLLVELFYQAATARVDVAPGDRHPFGFYADEFQRFATPDFAKLLAEVPEYQVRCVVAHQFRGQFEDPKDPNRGATLNVANKAFFTISGADGLEIAPEIKVIPPGTQASGRRSLPAVSPHVVQQLVSSGHHQQSVRSFIQQYGKDAVDALAEPVRAGEHPYFMWKRGTYNYMVWDRDLAAGLDTLNEMLRRVMEGEELPAMIDAVYQVVVAWAGFIGFSYRDREMPRGLLENYMQSLLTSDHLLMTNGADYKTYYEAWRLFRERLCRERYEGKAPEKADAEERRLYSFLSSLAQTARCLALDPIYVESGRFEPVYDNRDIGTYLANMPPYHAKVKLRQGNDIKEYTIKTGLPQAPDQSPAMLLLQKTKIDAAMKGTYSRPVEAIDEEINKRQQVAAPVVPSRVAKAQSL